MKFSDPIWLFYSMDLPTFWSCLRLPVFMKMVVNPHSLLGSVGFFLLVFNAFFMIVLCTIVQILHRVDVCGYCPLFDFEMVSSFHGIL